MELCTCIVEILIVFAISGLSLSVSGTNSCPDGWMVFKDSCIFISSDDSSWEEANENCTAQNNLSKLINIRDAQDEDFLVKILTNLTSESNETDQFYIGLQGHKMNGSDQLNFTWTDSLNMYNFSNWQFNNESNASLFENGDDSYCVFYDTEVLVWRLGNCANNARFICRQPATKVVPSYCKQGWHEIQHFCIYLSEANITGYKAWKACRQLDSRSYFVWIEDAEKDKQIIDVLKTAMATPSEYYIGLSRHKSDSSFKWITGKMYNYTNWNSPNETNKTSVKGEWKLCAYYGINYKWWLDSGCSTPRKYVCQIRKKYTSGTSPEEKATEKSTESVPTPTKKTSIKSEPYTTKPAIETTTISPGEMLKNQLNAKISNLKGQKISDARATKELEDTKVLLSSISFEEMSDVQNAVENVEKLGEVIIEGMKKAGNITEPKKIQVQNSALVLGITLLPPNSSSKVQFPEKGTNGSIKLPASVFKLAQKTLSNSDGVGMTSLLLRDVKGEENNKDKKPVLNSGIMSTSVTVPDGAIKNLQEPVVIVLLHNKKLENDDKTLCTFIDRNTSDYSTKGCSVASFNKTTTVCHCTHLTSFAVLLDVHGNTQQTSDKHKFALLIVSVVGCCIALICFIAALVAFHFVISERRRRKTETLSIHKNLAVAEIFALVFFLLAYGVVEPKGLCFAIAFLLHYSLMAVFFWMLVEGLNLHRGTVQVFVTTSRMKVYYVIGWGLPWIFVITTAAIGKMEYAREDFCWLSQQFIWSFAGPVAVILFINFVILCIAIRVMLRRPKYITDRKEVSRKRTTEQELRIAFKTAVILLPLLGLTWCLGFLASHNVTGNTIIQYLFAIVNSLQGFYFFLAHALYDDDVLKATNNTSTRLKTYFSRTLSRSHPSNSSTSNGAKQTNGYCNPSLKGKNNDNFFEMPSVSLSTKPKESAPVLLNHKYVDQDGEVSSKCNDTNNFVSIHVPFKRNRVSSSSSSNECSEPAEQKETKIFKDETDSAVLFRRANSAMDKTPKKTSAIPRRSNSISELERIKLSKQISNESNTSSVSGRSNQAFLSGTRC